MPARPLRPGETPPKGTAVLKGQVMAAGTGTPVRRAQVRAMSMEGRGGGVTSTDAEGRYEIKELPAGRYNVTATQRRFRRRATYGQRRPGEPGTPIDLADGQTADKVNFVLSRGSVISGKIVDDGGEPVSGTHGRRDALPVHGRYAAAGAGRRRRQHRSHRRSRRLPPVRTAARRLLRQREQSQQHDDDAGHEQHRGRRLRADLFPRHAEHQRGHARHA